MGIVEQMILAERSLDEGDIERQLNNVIDRGLETYIRFIAAKGLAGQFLGLDTPVGQVSGVPLASESVQGGTIESLFSGGAKTLLDVLARGRLPF